MLKEQIAKLGQKKGLIKINKFKTIYIAVHEKCIYS